jgi:competence protein ComEA
MPELTVRNIAFMALVAATVAAVLAAVVLLAQQNDNAPILIIPPQEAPARAAAPASSPPQTQAQAQTQTEGLIDLNTASVNLLDTLPGIGPALAQAIIDFRENVHPFRSVAEVQEVSKIGPVTYENIRDLTTVSRSP